MAMLDNKKITTGYVTGGYPFEAMQYLNSMALDAGVDALWFGDHYVSFYSPKFWTPETTPAAESLPSPDIMYDHVVMMSVTATQTNNTFLGHLRAPQSQEVSKRDLSKHIKKATSQTNAKGLELGTI